MPQITPDELEVLFLQSKIKNLQKFEYGVYMG